MRKMLHCDWLVKNAGTDLSATSRHVDML